MSVNTLWTLITNYPMEGYSQQVNLEANGQSFGDILINVYCDITSIQCSLFQ